MSNHSSPRSPLAAPARVRAFTWASVLFGLHCTVPALAQDAPPTYQWLPAEAAHAGSDGGGAGIKTPPLPVTFTSIPKVTADASKFTRVYELELEKFGIRNNGTEPDATVKGLMKALEHAKTIKANRIVFPKGTYLVDAGQTILLDHKDTIIDLNGSTIKVAPNALERYVMMSIIDGAENLRLTNGTLLGDRLEHDYKTVKGTHEHCSLLAFDGGKNLEIDRLNIWEAPGFSVATRPSGARGREQLLKLIYHPVWIRDLVSGAFSDKGEPIADGTKVRSSKPYDISKCPGNFEFGYTPGYMGFPFILDRHYQVVFLDKDQKFLEKRRVLQFRKVSIPEGAHFVHLEFNQPSVSQTPAHAGAGKEGFCGRITSMRPPTDVHFHDNNVSRNRGLGLAFCGGHKWIIENNVFEGNGGQAPSYAIDFEDGWEMMQDVVLRKNTFKGNDNDLVVCAGTELLFEENQFHRNVYFYGRAYNYTVRRNKFLGATVTFNTRTGVLNIEGNEYNGVKRLTVGFDSRGAADGFARTPGQIIATPATTLKNESLANIPIVTGTYLKLQNCRLDNVGLVASDKTALVQLEGCTFTNVSLTAEAGQGSVPVILKNNKGELPEKGPGLARFKK